jgi:protein dithiol oxidoreductase (disulfide-forming)
MRVKILLATLLAVAALSAGAVEVTEGRQYERLQVPQPTENAGKVEVIEFFWYGCSHCADFDPLLNSWIKKLPADVSFRRVPAVFRDTWAPGARLYYTLEAMGLLDKLHGAVFNAIHKSRINLHSDEKATLDWIVRQGVDRQKFSDMYHSFSIAGKVKRATEMTQEYGFSGVPVLVIGGKYMPVGAGSYGEMLQVADALIVKNRAEIHKK